MACNAALPIDHSTIADMELMRAKCNGMILAQRKEGKQAGRLPRFDRVGVFPAPRKTREQARAYFAFSSVLMNAFGPPST